MNIFCLESFDLHQKQGRRDKNLYDRISFFSCSFRCDVDSTCHTLVSFNFSTTRTSRARLLIATSDVTRSWGYLNVVEPEFYEPQMSCARGLPTRTQTTQFATSSDVWFHNIYFIFHSRRTRDKLLWIWIFFFAVPFWVMALVHFIQRGEE